ncbi:MAG: fasciclin domain-containing protein [Bacteroidaceae bacterium]|nr:fasciclin domain-containing protein [Bacteroidaceae bacterium]
MKTMLKHKLIVATMAVAALFASYSCEDSDTYTFPEPSDSELSMLTIMQKDPDYANFLAVVDMCGEGCLDSLFNQSRVYTVWAPTNEAVDKEALIARIENGERETVFQEFVKYHISNYRQPANGTLDDDNNLVMLNGKYVKFVGDSRNGYTFGGQEVVESNILARNGLIHKIASTVEYKPSIWEAIKNAPAVKSFWQFCKSFTVKDIDHNASIPGPIVNQQQTYLDTIYKESNEMLHLPNVGPVDNEDSTFIVFVPTSEVWEQITTEAAEYFKFDDSEFTEEQKIEADSLRQVRGAKEYLRYLTYSMTDQKNADGLADFDNLPDSLVAMVKENPRKKIAVADFAPIEIVKASNGELRILDHMPFKPTDLWHDTIRLEAENQYNVRKGEDEDYVWRGNFTPVVVDEKEQNPIHKDVKVSADRYMLASPESGVLPTCTYFVRDILSAKYKIAVVSVPEDILTKGDGVVNDNLGAIMINVAQSGKTIAEFPDPSKQVNLRGSAGKAYLEADAIRPDKTVMDTIFLCDEETGEPYIFDFEFCEKFNGFSTRTFEDKDYTLEITVSAAKLAGRKQGSSYAQNTAVDNNIRLDAILIIPVKDEEDTDK